MRLLKLKKCPRVHGLHFAPDGGRLLAVGGLELRRVDTAVWLDLATGEAAGRIDQFADTYAVSPDLTRFVLAGADESGRGGVAPVQWTPLTGDPEWRLFPGRLRKGRQAIPSLGSVYGMAFDPSGQRLAVGHGREWFPDYRWEFGLTLLRLDPPAWLAGPITTAEGARVIAFDAAGGRVALAGGVDGDPVVEVYDVPDGQAVYRYRPPATVTRCVVFTPDGRLVAANGRNVYVLPADRPEPLFELAGHGGQVNAVAVSPDGRRLLTASHDGAIRAWDAATGAAVGAFDWKLGPVTALAFAPDGLTCAAAAKNGRVVVWDVDG